jgi:hypothetical protein
LDEWKILQGTHGFSSSKWRCSSVTISAWANPMKVYTVVPRFQIPELTLVLWLGLTWTRFTRYYPAISGTVIALSEFWIVSHPNFGETLWLLVLKKVFSVRDYACDRHPASINGLAWMEEARVLNYVELI